MKRMFPLAGLLRLRHLQQDQAAVGLAAANSAQQGHAAIRGQARAAVLGIDANPSTIAAMQAMAAARSSSRSMLADLEALGANHQAAVDAAQAAFDAARADAIRLEKLELRHTEALAAEDLQAEQLLLDEIASTRWHRDHDQSGDQNRDQDRGETS